MGWEVFGRFYNAHWFLTGYSVRNFPNLLKDAGVASPQAIALMEDDVNSMIFDVKQFELMGSHLADRLLNDDDWRSRMNSLHEEYTTKYFAACERLRKKIPSRMSDKKILSELNKILPYQEKVRILGTTINGLPLDGRNHFSNSLREELMNHLPDFKGFENYWTLLTRVTRPSMRQKRDVEMAGLAMGKEFLPRGEVEEKLKKIYDSYLWLDYMYYGPPASFNDYEMVLESAFSDNRNLHLTSELTSLEKNQGALMDKMSFNARARHLVALAQHVLWQKAWRKDVEYHGFYCYEPFFKEIAGRKGVKDWRDVLYLLPWELEGFILNDDPGKKSLRERRKFSVVVSDLDGVRMLEGKEAKDFYETLHLDEEVSHLTEVHGQCAFTGKVRGRVRIIHVPKDMEKMRKGDIIISQATSPDLISAMEKASAIVTNTGGLICHAAIIARELQIPCIVGTIHATRVFKDGDLVEVDAFKGVVTLVN